LEDAAAGWIGCWITLEGEAGMVKLRSLDPAEIDAVHALISRMDVVRHMLWPLCSRVESEKFLRDSR
jgi:hypothetical protein